MQSHFDKYLENIGPFVAQEAPKKPKKKKPLLKLAKARRIATEACDGPIDSISRLFNEFPLDYTINVDDEDEDKTFCVISNKTHYHWLRRYATILNRGELRLITDNNNAIVTTTDAIMLETKELASSIIATACEDLLDEKGQLKSNVIAFFQFQPLLEKYQKDLKKIDDIIAYLIFSYCAQLVVANLMTNIINRQTGGSEDCKLYGQQVIQSDRFNRFFRELLISSDEEKALQFTSFFRNRIADCIALRAIQNCDPAVLVQTLLKRPNADDLIPAVKDATYCKENRNEMVQSLKGYLKQQHDVATQIKILDDILANNTLGSLLNAPRHPWYDAAVSFAQYIGSFFYITSAPTYLTDSLVELTQYRDSLKQQAQPKP